MVKRNIYNTAELGSPLWKSGMRADFIEYISLNSHFSKVEMTLYHPKTFN
jgi:hypothetical protein